MCASGPLDDPARSRPACARSNAGRARRRSPTGPPRPQHARSNWSRPAASKPHSTPCTTMSNGWKIIAELDVDARDAVMELMPGAPQQVEIMHRAVRPVAEEGGQHPKRSAAQLPQPLRSTIAIGGKRHDQQRREDVDDQGQRKPREPDQPPMRNSGMSRLEGNSASIPRKIRKLPASPAESQYRSPSPKPLLRPDVDTHLTQTERRFHQSL